jgi:ribosomal protein S18 acetylase RimI-like enzyme
VRGIEPEDVHGAALLHRITFPDYFLTHMGQGFVERFYSEFVGRNGNYGYVAICGKELVGSVIGTLDSEAFFHHFYRRSFPSLALISLGRFMVDPYVRRNLRSRMARVRQALRTVAARSQQVTPSAETPAPDRSAARLLSISVHPQKRGLGLADQLVDRYCEELWHDGIEWVGLSVRPENARAIAFYERTGWQRTGSSAEAVQYTRSTRSKSVEGRSL